MLKPLYLVLNLILKKMQKIMQILLLSETN